MGDGSIPITSGGNNCVYHLPMTNRTFLEWVDDQLGILTTGVSLKKTASELASNNRRSGFSPDAREENYHDMYTVWTRTHPFFNELRETWYPEGVKHVPDNLEFTPTVATFWYLCDRYLDFGRWGRPRIGIKASNESERPDLLTELVEEIGLSTSFQ